MTGSGGNLQLGWVAIFTGIHIIDRIKSGGGLVEGRVQIGNHKHDLSFGSELELSNAADPRACRFYREFGMLK